MANEDSISLKMCREYLGKEVTITIDQAFGTTYENALYTQNYGFVPGTSAPDGAELDAYSIGPQKPLETFTGDCIAIIHRFDDDDDKLIVVPEGTTLSDDEIEKAVNFREKFFDHCILRS